MFDIFSGSFPINAFFCLCAIAIEYKSELFIGISGISMTSSVLPDMSGYVNVFVRYIACIRFTVYGVTPLDHKQCVSKIKRGLLTLTK